MRALLVASILALVPAKAFACSCAAPPPAKKALSAAAAVFTGTVTEVVRIDERGTRTKFDPERDLPFIEEAMKNGGKFPPDRVEVTFAIDRVWKGVEKDTVVLKTGIPVCCICIIPFREGETWMIYADASKDGSLSTSRCSRTTELKFADKDIKALGKPARTVATPRPDPAPKQPLPAE